jgi:ACR3 family arsenite transporter
LERFKAAKVVLAAGDQSLVIFFIHAPTCDIYSSKSSFCLAFTAISGAAKPSLLDLGLITAPITSKLVMSRQPCSTMNPTSTATLPSPAYLFEPSCKSKKDCDFCEGLADFEPNSYHERNSDKPGIVDLFKSLSWMDRTLALQVLVAMVVGVVIGVYAEQGVKKTFQGSATWDGVSIPILVGLLIMMWPPLTKIEWENLPTLLNSRTTWKHLMISFVLNWIIAPFVMLGLAWAALPESSMARERKGLLLVGVARCIAMVLIWTTISQGDTNYCALLVLFNSLLQVVLFSPYAVLFINYFGGNEGANDPSLALDYSAVSRAVGIYLGIPLAAGLLTRLTAKKLFASNPSSFKKFIDTIGPIAVLGLLYTIIVLFANQGKHIVNNIGSIFRICVP